MEIVLAIIGSGALSALISGLFTLAGQKKARCAEAESHQKSVEDALCFLMYERIENLGKEYISAGTISTEQYRVIKEAHVIYHDKLNGNGYLDHIMDEVNKLQII